MEAQKKAETEAMLEQARAQQMMQKEHYLAVQAQRERQEFERVLRYVLLLFSCPAVLLKHCRVCIHRSGVLISVISCVRSASWTTSRPACRLLSICLFVLRGQSINIANF